MMLWVDPGPFPEEVHPITRRWSLTLDHQNTESKQAFFSLGVLAMKNGLVYIIYYITGTLRIYLLSQTLWVSLVITVTT